MSAETRPVQKWAQLLVVTKEFRRDAGIDVPAYIRAEFDRSLPKTHERVGKVNIDWIDGDDRGPMGQLNREMYHSLGYEPPENVWIVRVEALAAAVSSYQQP